MNIPGTVGGAVKMNANAYGGQLGRVLEWVEVAVPGGSERRRPEQLGLAYRSSNLGPHEVVARAAFALEPSDPERVKGVLADMRARRKAAQPSGIKTFGSTFKNPEGDKSAGVLLDEAGCRGLAVGGARFSLKHANFVENTGRRHHRRRDRAHGRGPPPGEGAVRDRARAGGPVPGGGGRIGALLLRARRIPVPSLPAHLRPYLAAGVAAFLVLFAVYMFWFRDSVSCGWITCP